MLGKLLYWSTQTTLALIAATAFTTLILPDTDGGFWVFSHLADATLLALAGTLTVFGVWAVDRLTDRAVASLRA